MQLQRPMPGSQTRLDQSDGAIQAFGPLRVPPALQKSPAKINKFCVLGEPQSPLSLCAR